MIEAGKLSKRITILEQRASANFIGEQTQEFEPKKQVWAYWLPLSAKVISGFRQAQLDIQVQCTVRYLDWLSPNHRIAYNNKEYSIVAILNWEDRNEDLVLGLSLVGETLDGKL